MYKICGLVISIWFIQSICAADYQRDALLKSLEDKDVALTTSLLNAGVEPECGMLVMCKTRAQAEALIAHGVNISGEVKAYGFLAERVSNDAELDLLEFFLQLNPPMRINYYGECAYNSAVMRLIDSGNIQGFEKQFKLLFYYNCCYDEKYIIGLFHVFADHVFSAMNSSREQIINKMRDIAQHELDCKDENIVHLLSKRQRTERIFDFKTSCRAILFQRMRREICQEKKKREQEATAKGLDQLESFFYVHGLSE